MSALQSDVSNHSHDTRFKERLYDADGAEACVMLRTGMPLLPKAWQIGGGESE